MTDNPEISAAHASELLTSVREATRQVRAAQRATWFPLAVFAAVFVAAIPVYRFAPHRLGTCRSGPGGAYVCTAVQPAVLVYWPVALVLAYAAIAAFYLRSSRRRGVGTPVRPYVVVGIVLAVLLTGASLWRLSHPLVRGYGDPVHLGPVGLAVNGAATPAAAVGLALLVLAWVERSRVLLAFSAGYLVIVIVEAGRMIHSHSHWYFLPQLIVPAVLLALGSVGFAAFESSARRRPQ